MFGPIASTSITIDDIDPKYLNSYYATISPRLLVQKVMRGLYHQQ